MKQEELRAYLKSEKYIIRYNKAEDDIFYYVHIKGKECESTPYDRAYKAIEHAEAKV